MAFRPIGFITLLTIIALAPGCAGSRPAEPATVQVASSSYDTAFDAARRVLREQGFILERVDARAGIITTQAKTTAGLATPWDREQQTFAQEVEDLLQRQQRVVRITFEPSQAGAPATDSPAPLADVRETPGELVMRIAVTIQRVNVPGRRLEPEAIGRSSYAWDPALGARAMQPTYTVSIRDDREVAAKLGRLIRERAGLAAAAPGSASAAGR